MRHDSKVSAPDNRRLDTKAAAPGGRIRMLDCGHDAGLEQQLISARSADRSDKGDDLRNAPPSSDPPAVPPPH